MKNRSFLAGALLLFVVLGCGPSNNSPNRSNQPSAGQGSGQGSGERSGQGSGQDGGPVSQSGIDREDYGPTRDPYENADSYKQKNEGRVSPCSPQFDSYHDAYFQQKNNQMTVERFREYESAYNACVEYYYRQR